MIFLSKLLVILTFAFLTQQQPLGESYCALIEIPKSVTESGTATTRGIIDFKRPDDAVQLVGDAGSAFIPESTEQKSQWTFENGVLTASSGMDSVVTPDAYQDFRLHVEFNVNDAGNNNREMNGNSGVYLQQRYELQITNSFGIPPSEYKASYCGSVYLLKKPDLLVNKPAGEWQSFDIAFRAARFADGKKTENARVTVYQNEKLIHDDYSISHQTGAGKKEDPTARPIKLQGHRNPVRFRNVWIQELSLDGIRPPQ